MKLFLARMLNFAAVGFGLAAATVRPSAAFQSSSCTGWTDPACSVTSSWECSTYGFCPLHPTGTGFVCCIDGSITRGFEYYD